MYVAHRPRVLCLPTGPDEYAAAVVRALAGAADVEFILPEPMLDRYRDDLPAGVQAFHAGTTLEDGQVRTSGGRVLTLVGRDRAAVYDAAHRVSFSGKQYRTDIGLEVAAAAR